MLIYDLIIKINENCNINENQLLLIVRIIYYLIYQKLGINIYFDSFFLFVLYFNVVNE